MRPIHNTIGKMIDKVVQTYPGHEALVHTEMGVRYNYALFAWEVSRLAKGLIALGVEKGDAVALWATNLAEWLTAQVALAKLGVILVPLDPGIEGDDLRFILRQSDCRAIIVAQGLEAERGIDMLVSDKGNLASLEHVIVIQEAVYPDTISWPQLTAMGDEVAEETLEKFEHAVRPEEPVAIMYTSGTTGKPKGVVLDHLGLINKSVCSTERQGLTREDRLILFFPLYHMFGNTCIALAGLLKGATLIMPCRVFEPSKILKAIKKERGTAIYGSPSMFIALLEHPDFDAESWQSLTKGTIGGAPCPMELMRKLVEDIGLSDVTVGYGITEASSWITMTQKDDPIEKRVSTIGKPLPCCRVKIVDPSEGTSLAPSEQGELCTKGYLMQGYHKQRAATSAAIDRDGWFHTGDLGKMDAQGYVRLTGRLKEVIVREGVEILPAEVEEVFYELAEVSEAQVFGFSHSEKGQRVAAWIKLKDGCHITVDRLKGHARERLDAAKLPDDLEIVRGFPMTRSGKVQKFRMAEQAAEKHGKE